MLVLFGFVLFDTLGLVLCVMQSLACFVAVARLFAPGTLVRGIDFAAEFTPHLNGLFKIPNVSFQFLAAFSLVAVAPVHLLTIAVAVHSPTTTGTMAPRGCFDWRFTIPARIAPSLRVVLDDLLDSCFCLLMSIPGGTL
jgi:hypothetical protein